MRDNVAHLHLEYRKRWHSAARRRRYLTARRETTRPVERVDHVESGNMPGWCPSADGSEYWEAADAYSRSNGRRFFEIEVALPLGLSLQEQVTLARTLIEAISGLHEYAYGKLPWTLAIHGSASGNPHFHIMLSPAINDGITRTPATWFKRYSSRAPERGGARKCRVITRREWLLELRARWEQVANVLLGEVRPGTFIDCRSHAERGLNQRPTLHLGPRPSPARVLRNREIAEENARREQEELEAAWTLQTRARQVLDSCDWWTHLNERLHSARRIGSPLFTEWMTARVLVDLWKVNRPKSVGGMDNAADWGRSLELIAEPAYQFAASRLFGDGWIVVQVGPAVVWTHDLGDAVIDVGGAVIPCHGTPLENLASRVLFQMRHPARPAVAVRPSPSQTDAHSVGSDHPAEPLRRGGGPRQ